ncbi:MAG TPA: GGDEF domain-containing protein [Bauldia sp.]|nr:GGDEF domain-containing protein [Bauldia sp.]
MSLDLPTLMAVESFIAALSGLVILLGCPRGRDSRGSVWWATGSITAAAGIAFILYALTHDSIPLLVAANIAIVASPAFYWTAARRFSRRVPVYALIPAGALLLALGSMIPAARLTPSSQMGLSLAINAIYFYAAAIELWRGRAERLLARWMLMALLCVHATVFAAGSVEAFTGAIQAMDIAPLTSWFGLIHFESIAFSVGSAAFVVAFIRERGEARQRTAAETDPLTSVATRRTLLEQVDQALEHSLATDEPLSLVVFDLDRFKSINDRFGHAVGDSVLMRFGEIVRGVLRPNDHVGRLGGEEFALLLPGTGLGAAMAIAERVRAAFEADCKALDNFEIGGTVSAGVTTANPHSTLQSMLIAADEGLYEAKAQGRNRVERAPTKISRDGKRLLNPVA